MDLELNRTLELFGLKSFVENNAFPLMVKTLNTAKMAIILHADLNQVETILEPPDPFNKNRNLYTFILQKIPSTSDFLNALDSTNNGHIITFIKSQLPSSTQNAPSTLKIGQRVRFNLRRPIQSFEGREDFLNSLHEEVLKTSPQNGHCPLPRQSLHQVKIISGVGGIGKTEAARSYILGYDDAYDNIIWIDAQSIITTIHSFFKLAEQLEVPTKNQDGIPISLDRVVDAIYTRICMDGQKSLLVFDNADEFDCTKTSEGINKFMFSNLVPESKPYPAVFLITSRNPKWSISDCSTKKMELPMLTLDESSRFIIRQLDLVVDKSEAGRGITKEVDELATVIGGLPLALQQAVAFIKQQRNTSKILGTAYQMSNFIAEFEDEIDNYHEESGIPYQFGSFSAPADLITWNLTYDKIKGAANGETALKIIELLSFFYADNVPVRFLLQLLPDTDEAFVAKGLTLLEKYSLIKVHIPNIPDNTEQQQPTDIGSNFITMQRHLQFFIQRGLEQRQDIQGHVHFLLNKANAIVEHNSPSRGNIISLNIQHLLSNPFNFIEENEEFFQFILKFCERLARQYWFQEALILCQKLYQGRLKSLEKTDPSVIDAANFMSKLLSTEHMAESLENYRSLLNKQKIYLSENHQTTIATKCIISDILRELRQYEQSITLLWEVLDQKLKMFRDGHPENLRTREVIVLTAYYRVCDKQGIQPNSKYAGLLQQLESTRFLRCKEELYGSVKGRPQVDDDGTSNFVEKPRGDQKNFEIYVEFLEDLKLKGETLGVDARMNENIEKVLQCYQQPY